MFINEMYKIEKIIHSYKMAGITDVKDLVTLSSHHKLSESGKIYYFGASIIPYNEMLEYINYYNTTDMEETTEMLWWTELTEKYNKYKGLPILFSENDAIFRFQCVEKLSKNPIYGKKLAELYGIKTESNKIRLKK